MRTIYESRETHLNMFYIGDCPDWVSGWCRHVEPRFVFELSISSRYVSRHPVSDWVCISPTKTLHQAASPSAVYVSHQAEYCTRHYPPMVYISQALSAPPATAITPSEDQHHPWGLSWTGVFWRSEEEKGVYVLECIPLLHYIPEGCALSTVKSAQSFFGIAQITFDPLPPFHVS